MQASDWLSIIAIEVNKDGDLGWWFFLVLSLFKQFKAILTYDKIITSLSSQGMSNLWPPWDKLNNYYPEPWRG